MGFDKSIHTPHCGNNVAVLLIVNRQTCSGSCIKILECPTTPNVATAQERVGLS